MMLRMLEFAIAAGSLALLARTVVGVRGKVARDAVAAPHMPQAVAPNAGTASTQARVARSAEGPTAVATAPGGLGSRQYSTHAPQTVALVARRLNSLPPPKNSWVTYE